MCIRDRSKQYRLEDQLLKYFPEEIEKHKGFIKGFESDLEVLAAHPHPEDGFAGMETVSYTHLAICHPAFLPQN